MFDKAEVAGRLARLQGQREEAAAELKALEADKSGTGRNATEIAWCKRQLDSLDGIIDTLEKG